MGRRTIPGMRSLITGASSGIGCELARQLVAAGADVLVTARRAAPLERLIDQANNQPGRVSALVGDVTDASHRERLIDAVRNQLGGLDLLVNNAGIGGLGPFAEADPERLRRLFEVNFFAPVELIRGALPLLRAGRTPLIVNIGSVLGHRAVPRKSEYCASKFALHGFSDALRAELASERIGVLLVSPSTTRTEFFDHVLDERGRASCSDRENPGKPVGAKAPVPISSQPRRVSRGASAEWVARQTIRAIRRGRHEIILTPGGKLLVWLDRLCPTLANWLVAHYTPKL